MKIKSEVLTTEDIHSIISKNYTHTQNKYCVFIQPNGIVDMEEVIEKYKLNCTIYELSSEELMFELYEKMEDAFARLQDFSEMVNYFYIAVYHDGEQLRNNLY